MKYTQQYTRTSFVYPNADTLQDFKEAIVTQLCRRLIQLSQNQSLWRAILTHAQRTKSILSLPDGAAQPKWLEYIYRTAHPALRWLPTKLAEWIGENMQEELGFQIKLIREQSLAPAGLLQSSTTSCMTMLWQVN